MLVSLLCFSKARPIKSFGSTLPNTWPKVKFRPGRRGTGTAIRAAPPTFAFPILFPSPPHHRHPLSPQRPTFSLSAFLSLDPPYLSALLESPVGKASLLCTLWSGFQGFSACSEEKKEIGFAGLFSLWTGGCLLAPADHSWPKHRTYLQATVFRVHLCVSVCVCA